jgi:hypothetical protein
VPQGDYYAIIKGKDDIRLDLEGVQARFAAIEVARAQA